MNLGPHRRRRIHAATTGIGVALLAAAALWPGSPGRGIGPGLAAAGDEPEGVLIEWLFTETEDPWRKGVSGQKGSFDWGTVYSLDDDDEGWIQFDGVGGSGRPNAWLFLKLTLPVGARTLQFDASGHDRAGADANFRVRIVEDGDSTTLFNERVTGREDDYRWRTHEVDIQAWSGREVTLYFEQNDNGPGIHEQVVLDNVRILGEVTCAIEGLVTDGDANLDPHANPLPNIRLQLWTGGAESTPVGPAVASDAEGRYCIPSQQGVTDPDNYKLRATLIDAANDPPLLETRRTEDGFAGWTEIPISADDFGSEQVDITFTGTPDRPWLADLANIHWQSDRFVRWAVGPLAMSNAQFETVIISAFDSGGTRYRDSARTAFLQMSDSVFAKRSGPYTECPENCEWHEIAHHIGHRLVIADTSLDGPCDGREPHGGWLNATTCDSLSEGFAAFLAVLGSVDIDRDRGTGYGTPEYSSFGYSLEDNTFKPWTVVTHSNGSRHHEEDATVAQLLWDLQDATPDEGEVIPIGGSPDPSRNDLLVEDLVALTGVELVHIMDGAEPQTIAELYEALRTSPDVPAVLKVRNPDFDEETIPQDITPLMEAFLLHGFHPVRDEAAPRYELGDRVPYTDHLPQPPGYVERPHFPSVPGAALRLVNPTAAERTYLVEVDYPSTSSRFEIAVPAGGEILFGLKLPPNPWVVPGEGEPPAACNDPESTITVTVSAGDVAAQTFDNCAYNQALFTATGDAAMTFGEASPVATGTGPTAGPGASAVPGPASSGDGGPVAILAIVAIAVAAAAIGGWLALRRRRTT
jgi:hypothetical protein